MEFASLERKKREIPIKSWGDEIKNAINKFNLK